MDMVSEAALSEELGLHRKDLRKARKELGILKDGPPGGLVMLSGDEVMQLAEKLGISASVAREAVERIGTHEGIGSTKKDAPATTGAGKKTATVRDAKLKNRRILLAVLEDGTAIRVRVKNNAPFRRGMEIPVRQVSGTFYEFTGRMPRMRRVYTGRV